MLLRSGAEIMIRYINVTKKYGEVTALNNVTIEIRSGKITALLGPNGSGKTTLFKLTLGIIKPDEGEIIVDGINVLENPIEARKIIGYSPEEITLFESLTPIEMYKFLSEIYGLNEETFQERLKLYLKLFNLTTEANKLCGEMSHGNRRKVSIVSALLHDPDVLILDEPFSGLDPEAAKILKEIMKKHAKENRTVLFSTHILQIAEAVADHIIIINHGDIVAEGNKEELERVVRKGDLETIFLEATGLSKEVDQLIKTLWGE